MFRFIHSALGFGAQRLSEKGTDPLPNRAPIPQTGSISRVTPGGLTPFRIASQTFDLRTGLKILIRADDQARSS